MGSAKRNILLCSVVFDIFGSILKRNARRYKLGILSLVVMVIVAVEMMFFLGFSSAQVKCVVGHEFTDESDKKGTKQMDYPYGHICLLKSHLIRTSVRGWSGLC